MKFRDIAKMHAFNRGLKAPITAGDLEHYIEQLGDGDSVTTGRIDKANDALNTLATSLITKWGLSKKFLKAPLPILDAPAAAGDED